MDLSHGRNLDQPDSFAPAHTSPCFCNWNLRLAPNLCYRIGGLRPVVMWALPRRWRSAESLLSKASAARTQVRSGPCHYRCSMTACARLPWSSAPDPNVEPGERTRVLVHLPCQCELKRMQIHAVSQLTAFALGMYDTRPRWVGFSAAHGFLSGIHFPAQSSSARLPPSAHLAGNLRGYIAQSVFLTHVSSLLAGALRGSLPARAQCGLICPLSGFLIRSARTQPPLRARCMHVKVCHLT